MGAGKGKGAFLVDSCQCVGGLLLSKTDFCQVDRRGQVLAEGFAGDRGCAFGEHIYDFVVF